MQFTGKDSSVDDDDDDDDDFVLKPASSGAPAAK